MLHNIIVVPSKSAAIAAPQMGTRLSNGPCNIPSLSSLGHPAIYASRRHRTEEVSLEPGTVGFSVRLHCHFDLAPGWSSQRAGASPHLDNPQCVFDTVGSDYDKWLSHNFFESIRFMSDCFGCCSNTSGPLSKLLATLSFDGAKT